MKLLLVAHHFPPMGGAGVQRVLKFARYLGEFGVEVTVLAGADPDYLQDSSLLAELPPAVAVHRVPHRSVLQRLLAWRARGGRAAAVAAAGAAVSPQPTPTPQAPSAGRSAARDALLAAWAAVQWPDERGGWARAALATGRRLLAAQRFDIVLSSAPPVATHALARRLAREAGLPWVADWRDLWADNPGYAAPRWRRAIDRRVEARWLRDAAGVVAVTPSWRQGFEDRLRAAGSACPVAWIPNGYDEADFAALPAKHAPADAALRLVHTGSFYGPRDPATLLAALDLFLARQAGAERLRLGLHLRLVGAIGSRFDAALAAFDARHPGVVERLPYVPHAQALAEMRAADALLLVVGAGDSGRRVGGDSARAVVAGTLPGKLFEYLRAGPPVLLLGDPAGDAAALLRAHGRGWVADETDPAAIARALACLLEGPAPALAADANPARFERRALAGELADFLRVVRRRFEADRGG